MAENVVIQRHRMGELGLSGNVVGWERMKSQRRIKVLLCPSQADLKGVDIGKKKLFFINVKCRFACRTDIVLTY